MRPLTKSIPKPLLEVNGKPLLCHQIECIASVVECIAVSVGYKGGEVSEVALLNGADLIIQNQTGGNAAWLNHTLIRNLNDHVLVITSDNLMQMDFKELEKEIIKSKDFSYLVTRENASDLMGDRIIEENGQVTSISNSITWGKLATGLQFINPRRLDPKKSFSDFHEVWDDLIQKNLLRTSGIKPSEWMAIDTLSDLERARETTFGTP